MTTMVEGAGVELACVQRGSGRAVLLIHGLAADAQTLAPTAEALAGAGARVITYDRRGYGSSGAPEPYEGTTVEEQAQDAVAVLGLLAASPAIVAGEGFGALIALDLMKRHPALVAGAVLVDPPLLALVPAATEALGAQRERIQEAVWAHGPPAGVEAWLQGRAEGPALERARAAHRAFFADYAGLAGWPVTRRELRAMGATVVIVTGSATPSEVGAAADALNALLPNARHVTDGDVVAAVTSLLTR